MALAIRSTTGTSNSAAPLLKRDPLMRDDYAGGVRHDFDLGFSWSYGGASPILDQAPVKDLAERLDAKFVVASGQAPIYTGRGVDFSPLTARGCYLEIPASSAQAIYQNAQRYLICAYLKLPAAADWNTAASYLPFLCFNKTANGFQGGVDLVTIGQATASGSKQLLFYRQTAVGTAETVAGPAGAALDPFVGQVVQVAMWRSATEQNVRLKSATNTYLGTPKAVGSDNTADFSGQAGVLGVGLTQWSSTLAGASATAKNFRIFRGFIEALGISGRDPVTVLDADWSRVAARNVFS